MRNRIKVRYFDAKNKAWVEIPDAIFPIQFADYLDERLDEAYLTIARTEIDHFPPTTPILVSWEQFDKVENLSTGEITEKVFEKKNIFFCVASDEAQQLPIEKPADSNNPEEKNHWKHTLYLIEETKALEGVICSSMTFTNTSEGVWAPETWVVA